MGVVFCLDILEKTQCFPLYRYENGLKIDNITDWGLQQFRKYYKNYYDEVASGEELLLAEDSIVHNIPRNDISKLYIFYYIYAVIHNSKYREKYQLNLKREFPKIPLYDDFYQWVNWGKKLINLHLNYERVKPYELKRVERERIASGSNLIIRQEIQSKQSPRNDNYENKGQNLKPKLKADKTNGKIIIDQITTLENVPASAWEYRLGNRSAIEGILEQYKEKKPKDQTIAERFNNYHFADYKEQVIDLLMRICTVSIETMKIIKEMTLSSEF